MMTHKGTQTIETQRLVLRRAELTDAEAMFRNWASDPEVTKYLTWPPHTSLEVSRRILENWVEVNAQIDRYHWMIVLKELGQPIGSISVVEHRDDIGEAEVGYCIGKQWWHKGLVTEAMRAVMGYLFDQVGMNRVEARHDLNNPHSGGVMKKCGMRYEGTLRRADRNNQGICDTAVYGMLKEEWK
jgi:ribosomal-protein-alanine N-acetyltransferase